MDVIRYLTGEPVEFGDHVSYRSMLFWWRWKPGRLSYLPGLSEVHPEMEHDGLTWVGVSGIDGTFRGVLVDPSSKRLQKSLRFVRRSDGGSFLTPDKIPEDEW